MTDKGWKGSTCQVATHTGVIVGRCADCGKRKIDEAAAAAWAASIVHWDKEIHA
jgi:hypothetical protein